MEGWDQSMDKTWIGKGLREDPFSKREPHESCLGNWIEHVILKNI